MATVYIHKMGIELEGSWKEQFDDIDIGHDGSVQRQANLPHWGELVSTPLLLDEALAWTRKYYADGVNATCGLHIHISLKRNIDYARLASRKFYNYFLAEWERWGKEQKLGPKHLFWKRLSGESVHDNGNVYAARKFAPSSQMQQTGKTNNVRRSHLNYCLKLHGTMECRLLPMFEKVDQAVSAVAFYAEMVEKYLAAAPELPRLRMSLRVRDGNLVN